MRNARRIVFTSGISTLVTRNPRTLRPWAWAAACFMLAIRSSPNLFMSCALIGFALEHGGELADRFLFVGRQTLPPCLGVHQQQIERAFGAMIKIDHAHAAPLARSAATPAKLAHAARLRDHIAGFRITGNEVHEGLALGIVPN